MLFGVLSLWNFATNVVDVLCVSLLDFMEPRTHLEINHTLVGAMRELSEGRAVVTLTTTGVMGADSRGLVHGGFPFGLADYAAMLAVNDPNVVLGKAEIKFLAPVVVGDDIEAIATVTTTEGKKRIVEVSVTSGDTVVLSGQLTCFVLDEHVLAKES